jgi:hypothetical protein
MTDRTQPLSARYKAGNRPAGASNQPHGPKPRRPLGASGRIEPLGPAHEQERSERIRQAKKGQLR